MIVVAFSTGLLAWFSVQSVYFAKPIAARVVEAGTSTPVPGITVVADWQLEGGMEGGSPRGHVAILETITDADGRFAFPGWGPRFALPRGRLTNRDPMLLLFKAGYFPRTLFNRQPSGRWRRSSDWDGETILMEPASRRLDRYPEAVQGIGDNVHISFFNPGRCAWREIPHLLLALDSEGAVLNNRFIRVPSLGYWKQAYPECRFDEEYVRRNGQWSQ